MTEAKTKPTEASVAAFLNTVDEKRLADCVAVVAMMEKITKVPPKMWGTAIIGSGTYTYKYESGKVGDWPVVGFSPRKQNLVLYIMPGFDDYADLLASLGKHSVGKSCLYIKQLSDIDVKVLEKLIKASVKFVKAKHPTPG